MWPPRWNKLISTVPSIVGEVGVLKFAHCNLRVSLKCYIVIEHEDNDYVGELIFTDRLFAEKIMTSLRFNIGRTIQEIGNIEIA